MWSLETLSHCLSLQGHLVGRSRSAEGTSHVQPLAWGEPRSCGPPGRGARDGPPAPLGVDVEHLIRFVAKEWGGGSGT